MADQGANKGNPNWIKGGPSPNPHGRGVSKTTLAMAAAVAKKGATGTDGFWAPGGFIVSGERDPKLQFRRKWVSYDNLPANVAIVMGALNITLTLAGGVKWTLTPNKNGGRNARKCMDLVQDGLIDARMPKPWRNVVRRQYMKKFRGFAMHAKAWRLDSKSRTVYANLDHRPQWTVERWQQVAEGDPWTAVIQRGRSGKEFPPIAREDLFYSVEDGISGEPDGLGLFRALVKLADTLEGFEKLEQIGFDSDMRGVPIGRAPIGKLMQEAVTFGGVAADDTAGKLAYVQAQVKFLDDLLKNHLVTKDRSVMFDSAIYNGLGTDGSVSPTSIYEWSLDTVKSAISGMPELGGAIARVTRLMAMLMNAEWLLLGAEDSGGTYNMHANKTAMMGLAINGGLDDIADDANRDLVWPMVARNGYNPETDAPTLEHEPIPTESVLAAAQALALLQQAPFRPDDKAPDQIRARLDVSARPKVDPALLMAPRGPVPNITTDKPAADTTAAGGDPSKAPTQDMTDNPDDMPAGEAGAGASE